MVKRVDYYILTYLSPVCIVCSCPPLILFSIGLTPFSFLAYQTSFYTKENSPLPSTANIFPSFKFLFIVFFPHTCKNFAYAFQDTVFYLKIFEFSV